MITDHTTMRLPVKNILYATDFSAPAEAALPYARGLAIRYGARVHGVHVHLPGFESIAERERMSDFGRAVQEQIKIEAEQLNAMLSGIPHNIFICAGTFWPTLLGLIHQQNIDLIVIGTRGRTGAGRVLLGSVAEEIFRRAPCPVLTVGPHISPHLSVSKDTSRRLELKQVLFATDFTSESLKALPYAASLAEENQARLTVLHVIKDAENDEIIHKGECGEDLLRKLRELLPPEVNLQGNLNFKVEQGDAAETILQVAKALDADLIVLGVRRVDEPISIITHLARSTAHRVLTHAECPVLTVRE